MGSIYLIRHGQASFGAENYDVLSPLGYRQSEALGDYLARRFAVEHLFIDCPNPV